MKQNPLGDRKMVGTLAHLRVLYARRVAVERLIDSLEAYQRLASPAAADKRLVRELKRAA